MTQPDQAAPHGTAEQLEAAQRAEWGTYVARVPIDFYGTRAFNTGDPVPASAVDGEQAWIRPEWVDTAAAPFAGSATVPPPEPPTVDAATVAAPPGSAAAPPPPPSGGGDVVTSTEG
jgi:hypothetical protein